MAIRFTLARTLAITLFAGLATGALTAQYTLAKARLDSGGETGDATSFARFAGNDAAAASAPGASRCPNCRDSYPIVYLDDPGRARTGVRVSTMRHDRAPADYALADDPVDPPPQTGWGERRGAAYDPHVRFVPAPYGDDLARAEREADREARQARLDRMARAVRQIERSVAQTAGVAVHRGAPPARAAEPVRPAIAAD